MYVDKFWHTSSFGGGRMYFGAHNNGIHSDTFGDHVPSILSIFEERNFSDLGRIYTGSFSFGSSLRRRSRRAVYTGRRQRRQPSTPSLIRLQTMVARRLSVYTVKLALV